MERSLKNSNPDETTLDQPPFSTGAPRPIDLILLGVLMILGTLLRFWDLPKQSLWLDEFTSIQFASLPLHDLFSGKGFNWHTPPFYYIALHFWGRLFPLTEIGLRLFSLTCDLACIPVCYFAFLEFSRGKLAEHRKSIAIAGAMLYTVSPFAIYYAQDGRMYTLLMLLPSS